MSSTITITWDALDEGVRRPAARHSQKGRRAMREVSDTEKALHDLINQAESLAREIRVTSSGYLSLAVVNNHGRVLREREGMGWHDAHESATRVFTAPDVITDPVLADALIAYKGSRGERPAMIAALTVVNLYDPDGDELGAALLAFRHGYHGTEGSMRDALAAALAARGPMVWRCGRDH